MDYGSLRPILQKVYSLAAGETQTIRMGPSQSLVNTGNFTVDIYALEGGNETAELKPKRSIQTPEYVDEKTKYEITAIARDDGGELSIYNARIFPETNYVAHPELGVPVPGYEPLVFFVDSTSGSDSGDGSYESPFLTMAHALASTPDWIIIIDAATSEEVTIAQSDLRIDFLGNSAIDYRFIIDLSVARYNIIINAQDVRHSSVAGNKSWLDYTGASTLIDSVITLKSGVQSDNAPFIDMKAISCTFNFLSINSDGATASAMGIRLVASAMCQINGKYIGEFNGANERGISYNEAGMPVASYGTSIINVKVFEDCTVAVQGDTATPALTMNCAVMPCDFRNCDDNVLGTFTIENNVGIRRTATIANLNVNTEQDLITEVNLSTDKIVDIESGIFDYHLWYADANITGTGATLAVRWYVDDIGGTLRELINLRDIITEGLSGSGSIKLEGPGKIYRNYKMTVTSSVAPAGGVGSNLVRFDYIRKESGN